MSEKKLDEASKLAARLTLFFENNPLSEIELAEFWPTAADKSFQKQFGKYKAELVQKYLDSDNWWVIFHFSNHKLSLGKVCNLTDGWVSNSWQLLEKKIVKVVTYKGSALKVTKKLLKETKKNNT